MHPLLICVHWENQKDEHGCQKAPGQGLVPTWWPQPCHHSRRQPQSRAGGHGPCPHGSPGNLLNPTTHGTGQGLVSLQVTD